MLIGSLCKITNKFHVLVKLLIVAYLDNQLHASYGTCMSLHCSH